MTLINNEIPIKKERKNHKLMTPEELKEYRKYYNDRRTNRVRKTIPIHHCDICNCDIKWDHMSTHRKSLKHKNNELKMNENKQLDISVE